MMELILGSVRFGEAELPSSLTIQASRSLRTIQTLDGGFEVQDTGDVPRLIAWSGILIGESAFARASALDNMRSGGDPIAFSCGDLHLLVRIARLAFSIRMPWWVPYSVVCLSHASAPDVSERIDPGISAIAGAEVPLAAGLVAMDAADGMAIPGAGNGEDARWVSSLSAFAESAARTALAAAYAGPSRP
ncbi:MAG: hypothetical protein ACU0B1_10555 [Thermohalobaculum sp.]